MATSPNISALSSYAGVYEKKLFAKLQNKLDAATDITVLPGVKGKLKLTKLRVSAGARPYTSTFLADGDELNYSGRDLEVKMGKREILVDPSVYRQTWMAEVMKVGVNPMDIPFAGYVWEQVMATLAAELNDNTIGFGFDSSATALFTSGGYAVGAYVKFVTGSITDYWKCIATAASNESPATHPAKWQKVNAEAIATGFLTLIAAELTASNLTAVATGAVSASNAVEKFELMLKAMPVAYRKAGFKIFCSYDLADKYNADYRDKFKKYVEMNESGSFFLDNTSRKVEIVPCTWLGTSQRMIATPKENLLLGTDLLSDINNIRTIEDVWTLKAGIAFAIGVQIRDLEAIKVNDQA